MYGGQYRGFEQNMETVPIHESLPGHYDLLVVPPYRIRKRLDHGQGRPCSRLNPLNPLPVAFFRMRVIFLDFDIDFNKMPPNYP